MPIAAKPSCGGKADLWKGGFRKKAFDGYAARVNEDGTDLTTPVRRIRDANTLRGLAHPVRIQLLEELALVGPMTATELAARVGESAANCSWHLRQLARYG